MDQDQQLLNIARWRTKSNRTARLGDAVKQLMENQILPRQAKFGAIAELWSQLLPAELHRHCKLADVAGGQLKVLVDSPTHLYELRLCSSQLLEELQQQCPRARIKKIKFAVGTLA
jgi:hypothetical protein